MIVGKYNRPIYVFIPLDPQASPNIVVVDYKGNIVRRTPLAAFSTRGFNVDAVADGKYAFLTIGPLSLSSTARVYRLTTTATQLVGSLIQADRGNVLVKFLKLFNTPGKQYGLATAVKDKKTSVRVWRYGSATNKFSRLTTYDVKKVLLGSAGLSLKAGTALVP